MNVFLIRTPRPTPSLDPYSLAFSSTASYIPHHLPILSTTFLSLPLLLSLIRRRPNGIRGIIVTSPRAMEAWSLALSELNDSEKADLDSSWRDCTWFVVGPATRDAVLRVYPNHRFIFGDETGSGENLGNFIRGHLAEHEGTEGRKGGMVVNLVGDKARDTIGRILGDEGVGVEKLLVYETCSLEQTFVRDLESVLPPSVFLPPTTLASPTDQKDEEEEEEYVCWFVLFSPSGSKAALRLLRQKGLIPPRISTSEESIDQLSKLSLSSSPSPNLSPSASIPPSPSPASSLPSSPPTTTPPIRTAVEEGARAKERRRRIRIKFAVIGPTTRDYLETDEGITVLADAKSPDPVELYRAIREADEGL